MHSSNATSKILRNKLQNCSHDCILATKSLHFTNTISSEFREKVIERMEIDRTLKNRNNINYISYSTTFNDFEVGQIDPNITNTISDEIFFFIIN